MLLLPHELQSPVMNGNVLVGIDIETTGRLPGWHEIIQIGIQPLGADFLPLPGVPHFKRNIRPEYPERAEVEAMAVSKLSLEELKNEASQSKVIDWLAEYIVDLRLPFQRSLVPLAHNWAFEKSFLNQWLGINAVDTMFFSAPRDTMVLANFINDLSVMMGRPKVFEKTNLPFLCEYFGIPHPNAHDALADATVAGELYAKMIKLFIPS